MEYKFVDLEVTVLSGRTYEVEGVEFIPYIHICNYRDWKIPTTWEDKDGKKTNVTHKGGCCVVFLTTGKKLLLPMNAREFSQLRLDAVKNFELETA